MIKNSKLLDNKYLKLILKTLLILILILLLIQMFWIKGNKSDVKTKKKPLLSKTIQTSNNDTKNEIKNRSDNNRTPFSFNHIAEDKKRIIDKSRVRRNEIMENIKKRYLNRIVEFYRINYFKDKKIGSLHSECIINTGEVITGGAAIIPPFKVQLYTNAILINGLSIIPGGEYSGHLYKKFLDLSDWEIKCNNDINIICKKKKDLVNNTDLDEKAIENKLAEYARSLTTIKEVYEWSDTKKGNGITIMQPKKSQNDKNNREFNLKVRNIELQRRRRGREDKKKKEKPYLIKYFDQICKALKEGKCYIHPREGSSLYLPKGTINKINECLKTKPNLDSKAEEYHDKIQVLLEIMEVKSILFYRAAIEIIANWDQKRNFVPVHMIELKS